MATEKNISRWASHSVLSLLLRAAIVAVPAGVAVAVGAVASHVVPAPSGPGPRLAWLAVLFVLSTLVLIGVDRQLRRLLPLAALLKLSLIFPDRAPSRFRSAMRMGSVRQIQDRLEQVRAGVQPGEALDEAALRIVELATAMRVHDRRTRGHSERVRVYADMLGEELGLSPDDRSKLHWGALLHDIGKLDVPTQILNKSGKPSADEWTVLRGHPMAGKKILSPLAPWLGSWASAAWEHHERWDGAGYPLGLARADISVAGRIVAVADAFEVMTATRSYKKPMSAAEGRRELTRCAGSHFDPDVVRAMLTLSVGRLRAAMGPMTWLAQLPLLGWTAPVGMPATIGTTLAGVGRTIVLASAIHSVVPASVGTLGPVVEASATVPAVVHPAAATASTAPGATTGGSLSVQVNLDGRITVSVAGGAVSSAASSYGAPLAVPAAGRGTPSDSHGGQASPAGRAHSGEGPAQPAGAAQPPTPVQPVSPAAANRPTAPPAATPSPPTPATPAPPVVAAAPAPPVVAAAATPSGGAALGHVRLLRLPGRGPHPGAVGGA